MSARFVIVSSGVAAIVLLVYLGPIQTVLWNGDQAPGWAASLPWIDRSIAFARMVAPSLPAYDFFGRGVIVCYITLIASMAALGTSVQASPASRFWRRAILAALSCAMAADVVAYWIAGLEGSILRQWAFWWVEVPALGIAAFSLAGLGWMWRHEAGSRVLILAPLLAVIATVTLRYMPHGPLLGFALATTIAAMCRRPATTGSR